MSDDHVFWDERYRAGRVAWDTGGVPAACAAFLRRMNQPGRVFVPGCGAAYEVKAFAEAGWDVLGIDFSAAAVDAARGVLGRFAECVRQADFFEGDFGDTYDVVYERTFLCSVSPHRWPEYARRVAGLVRTGGRLAGYFFVGDDPEPPPYPLRDGDAGRLFGPWFERVINEDIPRHLSLPVYASGERWQEWVRNDRPVT